MSVKLVGLRIDIGSFDWHRHPAYMNWIVQNHHLIHMLNGAEKQQVLNEMLSEYQGRLPLFKFNHVILGFDSQEDLTAYILAWS